jgi:hypothetical protein
MSDDLAKWESRLSPEFRACRDFHHAWVISTARKIATGYERELKCARCNVTKIQELDNFGFLVKTKFAYVEGYQRPEGAGRMTKDDNARIRLMGFSPRRKR